MAQAVPIPADAKFQDLTGKVFGRLHVAWYSGRSEKLAHWMCVCQCGTVVVRTSHSLKSSCEPSCGCFQKEFASSLLKSHGLSDRTEYTIWCNIKSRCFNENNSAYQNYGGRGISMHEPWRQSFVAFLADVGDRPSLQHSLDRINNDGNYEPGNVRWATMTTQSANRRTTTILKLNGITKPLTEWAVQYGISYKIIHQRIADGWSARRAVTTPIGGMGEWHARRLTFNGKTQTVAAWARETGIGGATICSRLDNLGWSIEKALSTPKRPLKPRAKVKYNGQPVSILQAAKMIGVTPSTLYHRVSRGIPTPGVEY